MKDLHKAVKDLEKLFSHILQEISAQHLGPGEIGMPVSHQKTLDPGILLLEIYPKELIK